MLEHEASSSSHSSVTGLVLKDVLGCHFTPVFRHSFLREICKVVQFYTVLVQDVTMLSKLVSGPECARV